MTRIWTPNVTRSQLKSDQIIKIWTPNMLSIQLESDKVNRKLNTQREETAVEK